ncbi:MAG: SprB repeat-containing protein [Bacteroidia bacterium]|nr:SprB repeat-containing protein [Bacteroidia bacterium]
MKKILLFSISGLFLNNLIFAQNSDLLWTSHFTGAGVNEPNAVTKDASGNIYTTGRYTGTVSQGAFSITAVGGNDIFISKHDRNGNIVWLKEIGSAGTEISGGIAISNDNNYIYVSGAYSNNCDFDGTPLASIGGTDLFLSKYSVDGTLIWAYDIGYGAGNQVRGFITTDNDNNIIMCGQFFTDITFIGGTFPLDDGGSGIRQNFIAKFDIDGNAVWAKKIPGDQLNSTFRTVRAYGNDYYFSGLFDDNLTFDLGLITSIGGSVDIFIYKTNSDGNGLWLRKIQGTVDDYAWRHVVDNQGNIFITGYYNSPTLTIDSTSSIPSIETLPNSGSNDIFLVSYSADGTLRFADNYGSGNDDRGYSINVNDDHVIFGGSYSGNISFGNYTLTWSASSDAFMVECDKNGSILTAKRGYGNSADISQTSTVDNDGCNIFLGDFTSNNINIEGNILTNALTGVKDMFIAKFGQIILSFSTTNVSCYNGNDGEILLTVTGDGRTPYSYSWSNGETTSLIDTLIAGWYAVTVTDANLATKVDSVEISQPGALSLLLIPEGETCTTNDGSINLTAAGGTPPYSYLWSTSDITQDISALPGNSTYYVTVTL